MSELVEVAIVASIAPTIVAVSTLVTQVIVARRASTERASIRKLVDGKSQEQLDEIKALKKEIARVSRSDDAETPSAREGGPVTVDHGVVTAEKTNRRETDKK